MSSMNRLRGAGHDHQIGLHEGTMPDIPPGGPDADRVEMAELPAESEPT